MWEVMYRLSQLVWKWQRENALQQTLVAREPNAGELRIQWFVLFQLPAESVWRHGHPSRRRPKPRPLMLRCNEVLGQSTRLCLRLLLGGPK